MYTLKNLPRNGVLRIYATCEAVTPESAEIGDAAERGWVDSLDSRSMYESRNDVSPIIELHVLHLLGGDTVALCDDPNARDITVEEADAEARDSIRRTLDALGAYENNGDGTLYGAGEDEDYATGTSYRYALHAHVKHYSGERGWVEDAVELDAV